MDAEIARLLGECRVAKRMLQRANRSRDMVRIITASMTLRNKRRVCKSQIRRAKRSCWEELCEEANNDIWGKVLQIVTKQFGRACLELVRGRH